MNGNSLRRVGPGLLAILFLCLATAAQAVTFYVAPNGRDEWSGRVEKPNQDLTDGPLATVGAAQRAIRQLKAAGPLGEPVKVIIAHGLYPLFSPIVFSPADSGTESAPIVYEAAAGATPVFDGGLPIGGFTPGPDGVWSTLLPEVAAGRYAFEQLFVDGHRATLARSPNKGTFYVAGPSTLTVDPTGGPANTLPNRSFMARPQDVAGWANNPEGVQVVAYFGWETAREHLLRVDPVTNAVFLQGVATWPFNHFGASQRYHVENFRAALDSPGEWYLDRKEGRLYYWPLPGQTPGQTRVVAPVTEQFVLFQGNPTSETQTVEHITLRGLGFRHGQYLLPPQGQSDGQAAYHLPTVIVADGARNIRIEGCSISHTGLGGIWFRRRCSDCTVTRCDLRDLGGGGLKISYDETVDQAIQRSHHITVDNNLIHGVGKIAYGAVGVWIGRQASDVQVTHNDISDLFYSGVSVGWNWGYEPTLARNHQIAFNHIHHVGQGVLSDMGGIYTLGQLPGTVLSNNVIHDVYSYDYDAAGAFGIYSDEGSTSTTIQNNLIYDTRSGGYNLHYGRGNTVRNNIFAFGVDRQINRTRAEDQFALQFTGNIVYWTQGVLFGLRWTDPQVSLSKNLYWNPNGVGAVFPGELTFDAWQAQGKDSGSRVADPLFENADARDFRLKPNSPALEMGFKPIDYAKAGLTGEAEWVAEAKNLTFAPLELAPPPPDSPPLTLNDGFEVSAVGSVPALASEAHAGKDDRVCVTDERASTGTHSLKFQDAPGLPTTFYPLLTYQPSHVNGLSILRFDLWLEPASVFVNEWRSRGVFYKVGPSVKVDHGQLIVNGKKLADLPAGQWIHFEILAGVGKASSGTWDLKVTVAGQPPMQFETLPFADKDWNRLDWLGFFSDANEATAFYLDQLQLSEIATKEPVPTPSPSPTPTPTPAATPEPTATPAPTPEVTATPASTPEPTATPAVTPTVTPTATATPEPTQTPAATPTATPPPATDRATTATQ